jgi:hypothetical protein
VTAEGDVPPLHVRAMGVTVRIMVPDQESHDRLARQWSRAFVPLDAGDEVVATISAYEGDADNESVRDYGVTTRVTMAALRATAGRRINLHAGGVADDEGRLLALVAPSGTGKTTATRALSAHLGYVSDETVSIDPDGTVYPHPKPLSVLPDEGAKYEKAQLSPDDVGLLPTPVSPRLARVVVLHRGVEGARGLAPLPISQALLQVVEQSSSLSQLPRPLRALVGLVIECGGVWALTYDEITDHVEELVGFLAETPGTPRTPGTPPRPPAMVWHDGQESFPLAPAEHGVPGPMLARLPFAEAVEIDDDLVVLTESHAWLLAELTRTIWLRLAQPCTFEELVAAAEEHHGAHERAGEIVRSAVATLAQEGLVDWGSLA